MHYKRIHAFLKTNCLKKLTITVGSQNVLHLLLNNSVLKYLGPTIHVAVMAYHTPKF
jgi:hypothetical protein